jgi:outer membrane protein TolC
MLKLLFALFVVSAHASLLEQTIETSWKKDAFISSQETRISAAHLSKFARFLPNNPQVTFTNADNASWRTYGITLDVGIPGKAIALSHLDSKIYDAEKREMSAKKNELAQFILGQFTSCAASSELLGVMEEATLSLETLFKTITARYEMGQATQAERIGIELQHRQALIEFNRARDESGVACTKFKEILSRYDIEGASEKDFILPDDLSNSLLSHLGSMNVELIRSKNLADVSRATSESAIWANLPDITFGYYRNYYRVVASSPIVPVQWTNSFMVSVNLPLFYYFYNRNELRRNRAELMITERRAEMAKLQSEQAMANARNEYQRNRKVLTKLRMHDLPMAETMVDSTLAAYKSGKLGFSELILSKRTWIDLRKEEVNLKQSLLTARLNCLSMCDGE